MRTAFLGGIIIGTFIVGWLGVFVLPVFVAIYQCIALFFLIKRKRINLSQMKEFSNPIAEIKYNLHASSWTKWIDSMKIYAIQFVWTYTRTTIFAVLAYFIKNIIFK